MNISSCYVRLNDNEICFIKFQQSIPQSEVQNLLKISNSGSSLIDQLSQIFRFHLVGVEISKMEHFGTGTDTRFWIQSPDY